MKAVASWRSQLQLFYKCPHYSSVGKEMTVLLQHMECSSVLLIFQKALFSCATVRQLSFQNITVLMLLKEDIILMKHLDYSKPVPVLIESVVIYFVDFFSLVRVSRYVILVLSHLLITFIRLFNFPITFVFVCDTRFIRKSYVLNFLVIHDN